MCSCDHCSLGENKQTSYPWGLEAKLSSCMIISLTARMYESQ